jgi:hypothetical protein
VRLLYVSMYLSWQQRSIPRRQQQGAWESLGKINATSYVLYFRKWNIVIYCYVRKNILFSANLILILKELTSVILGVSVSLILVLFHISGYSLLKLSFGTTLVSSWVNKSLISLISYYDICQIINLQNCNCLSVFSKNVSFLLILRVSLVLVVNVGFVSTESPYCKS